MTRMSLLTLCSVKDTSVSAGGSPDSIWSVFTKGILEVISSPAFFSFSATRKKQKFFNYKKINCLIFSYVVV